jgi:hypothetical protein
MIFTKSIKIKYEIMEYASTSHNRTVYAPPPVGDSGLCGILLKIG